MPTKLELLVDHIIGTMYDPAVSSHDKPEVLKVLIDAYFRSAVREVFGEEK